MKYCIYRINDLKDIYYIHKTTGRSYGNCQFSINVHGNQPEHYTLEDCIYMKKIYHHINGYSQSCEIKVWE